MATITESLFRSRSGGMIAALSFSTLAVGLVQICLPLELRQLRAGPNQIGVALSMFGLGMFAFEWVWGVVADRFGYRVPLIASQLLYAACILLLSRAGSIVLLGAGYFLASGMMVAIGPIARSYLGTALHARLRATGLALLTAQWVVSEALGAGAGGQLIDHIPIRTVLLGSALLPVLSAGLLVPVFREYSHVEHRGRWNDADQELMERSRGGASLLQVLIVTASIILFFQVGAGGEMALLPLLVTTHLGLSAASAGAAMLVVGLVGGLLLVPGGSASDRWGRRPTMVVGGILSAAGFVLYATSGGFGQVLVAAVVRALGASLIWPAATAWMSESMPRQRHALYMGLFGEFENVGVTLGPVLGGVAWSISGIQAAFYAYAVAAILAALIAAVMVRNHANNPGNSDTETAMIEQMSGHAAPGGRR
ncbi:MAG TPA: MFS transporter [Candidatus Sulfotelmatobacter sp.]|nr:MFS transporter [Candidatus Sulfotelmatobacter sp.]